MAEALGIASGIAGLISLTEIIVVKTSKYCSSAKNAKSDIKNLLERIQGLHALLSRLKLLAECLRANEDTDDTAEFSHSEHLITCRRGLIDLKKQLDAIDSNSLKGKLLWPLKQNETKAYADKFRDNTTNLSNALNADGMSALLKALSSNAKATQDIQELKVRLQKFSEDSNENIKDSHRREVFDWISKADPYQKHRSSISLRHPNTVLWFFECPEYKKWCEEANSAIWLYGIPGAGKTILSSAVIEELRLETHEHENHAIIYYYCEYKLTPTQMLVNIVGSLIKQLCACNAKAFTQLDLIYQDHSSKTPNPAPLQNKEITKLLRKLSRHFDCVMIVIDGIDECSLPEDRREILGLFTTLHEPQHGNIKVIYTSRDEFDIRTKFESFDQISIAARGHDLELFVAAKLEEGINDKSIGLRSAETKEKIITTIVEKANGMFQWAKCQIDELCHLRNDKARLEALEKLPADLFETYQRIIGRVNKSQDDAELVRRVLRWLAFGREPMTWNKLAIAISITIGSDTLDEDVIPDEDHVLYWCGSLVSVDKQTRVFSLSHFTVKEFLINEKLLGLPGLQLYYMSDSHSMLVLSKVCLTYILDKKIAREYGLETFDFDFDVSELAEDFLLHRHACMNWLVYAHKYRDSDELSFLARRLFEPSKTSNYILWLERLRDKENPTELGKASTLHIAAACGLTKICQWLVEQGVEKNLNYADFGTPLVCAIRGLGRISCVYVSGPNIHTVKLLLNCGACNFTKLKSSGGKPGRTPMSLALDYLVNYPEMGLKLLESIIEAEGISSVAESRFWCKDASAFEESELSRIIELFKVILWEAVNPNLDNLSRQKIEDFIIKNDDAESSSIVSQKWMFGQRTINPEEFTTRIKQIGELGQTQLIQRLIDDRTPVSALLDALVPAAFNGHAGIVELILAMMPQDEREASTVVQDAWIEAAEANEEGVLAAFLKVGFNVNLRIRRDGDNKSAISEAASNDCLEAIAYLLSVPKIDINSRYNGATLLHLAVMNGSKEIATALIDKGLAVFDLSDDGRSLLHFLFADMTEKTDSKVELLQDLLQFNCRTDVICHDGNSLLHQLVLGFRGSNFHNHYFHQILYLIDGDRSMLSKKDKHNRTPFFSAISSTNLPVDVILTLVPEDSSTFNDVDCNGHTILSSLVQGKGKGNDFNDDSVLQLISVLFEKADFDLGFRTMEGLTPLLLAGEKCNSTSPAAAAKLIKLLLNNGSKVNDRSPEGLTILHYIAASGFELGCSTILEFSPDITLTSECGESALLIAVFNGHINIVQMIMQQATATGLVGTLLQQANSDGYLPLHTAAYEGYSDIIQYLMAFDESPSIESVSNDGSTALHLAVWYGKIKCVNTLLDSRADASSENKELETPLDVAVRNNNLEIVRALLEHEANLNLGNSSTSHALDAFMAADTSKLSSGTPPKVAVVEHVRENGETPLQIAARKGFGEVANILIAYGADPTRTDDSGLQPWMTAAIYGHDVLSQTLQSHASEFRVNRHQDGGGNNQGLNKGPERKEDNDARLDDDEIPQTGTVQEKLVEAFKQAARSKKLSVCENLLAIGVNPNMLTKWDGHNRKIGLLHFATARSSLEIIQLLLDRGAKVDIQDSLGFYPLQYAAEFGDPGSIKAIALAEGNLNLSTALRMAVFKNRLENVNVLHELGANLDIAGPRGETLLQRAIKNGHLEMIQTLLNLGVDINAKDENGHQAVHYAAYQNDTSIFEKLIQNGANILARNTDIETPMHIAAKKGRLKSLQFLVNNSLKTSNFDEFEDIIVSTIDSTKTSAGTGHESPIESKDRKRNTPLLASINAENWEIAEYLVEAGSNVQARSCFAEDALFHACGNGPKSFIELLISKGSDPRAVSTYGEGCLHQICRRGSSDENIEIFRLLKNIGADASLRDINGTSPLHLCCNIGHTLIVEEFLTILGTERLNDESIILGTPLYSAAFRGRTEIVRLLLSAGANIDLGRQGESPIEGAALGGHKEVVEILIQHKDMLSLKEVEGTWSLKLQGNGLEDAVQATENALPAIEMVTPFEVSEEIRRFNRGFDTSSYLQCSSSCWCLGNKDAISIQG